ncbi:MAG: protein phosphatase 2C domain-containing protein [Planctomycetes bacterium]|nr:protein phosphatase 2C domain-containing protein [Planctomycetota bacterium]
MPTCPNPACQHVSEATDFCPRCQRSMRAPAPPRSPAGRVPCVGWRLRWRHALPRHEVAALPCLPGLLLPIAGSEADGCAVFAIEERRRPQQVTVWLAEREPIDAALTLVRGLARLLIDWHQRGYLCGDIQLDTLFIDEAGAVAIAGIMPLPIDQAAWLRPLPASAGFDAPEIRNRDAARVGTASDVYALAATLVGVAERLPRFADFGDLEVLAHQFVPRHPQVPPPMHGWLRRSLAMNSKERFPDVAAQLQALEEAWRPRPPSEAALRLSGGSATRPGWCKLCAADDERDDGEINADRALFLSEAKPLRQLVLVADGITACTIGSGARAATIVETTVRELWPSIRSADDVASALRTANERIVAEAAQLCAARSQEPEARGLMAASVAALYNDGRQAELITCGDVRAYLWSADRGLALLSADDHAGVARIVRGRPLGAACDGSEEALTACIGMARREDSGLVAQPPPLRRRPLALGPDDVLVLCSDGLTDYLIRQTGKGRWAAELMLETRIAEAVQRQFGMKQLANYLASAADVNGGGDNITVMCLRCQPLPLPAEGHAVPRSPAPSVPAPRSPAAKRVSEAAPVPSITHGNQQP